MARKNKETVKWDIDVENGNLTLPLTQSSYFKIIYDASISKFVSKIVILFNIDSEFVFYSKQLSEHKKIKKLMKQCEAILKDIDFLNDLLEQDNVIIDWCNKEKEGDVTV